MNKRKNACEKNKKYLILFLVLWIVLEIVLIAPMSVAIAESTSAQGQFELANFIENFGKEVSSFTAITRIGSAGAGSAFGKGTLWLTILCLVVTAIGIIKSKPKSNYEDIENGTGAYWDSEEKQYCNRTGRSVAPYSIRDILVEEENVLNEAVIDTTILEDIFSDSGLSFEEKKQGESDVFEDIDNCNLVLKDDLYGLEATKMYYTWEFFKYITKYYNRFFDIDKDCQRRDYLKELVPYILEYDTVIKAGTIYYRARKLNDEKLHDLDYAGVYKEMAPAPPKYATTNRMSPAGISYLYVASDRETAYKECRYKDATVMVAEYVLK